MIGKRISSIHKLPNAFSAVNIDVIFPTQIQRIYNRCASRSLSTKMKWCTSVDFLENICHCLFHFVRKLLSLVFISIFVTSLMKFYGVFCCCHECVCVCLSVLFTNSSKIRQGNRTILMLWLLFLLCIHLKCTGNTTIDEIKCNTQTWWACVNRHPFSTKYLTRVVYAINILTKYKNWDFFQEKNKKFFHELGRVVVD